MIYPHTLTAHPSVQVTDTDGNTVRRPTETGVPVAGFIQPEQLAVDALGHEHETRHLAFLDAAAPFLDAESTLDWDGHTYEATSPALRFSDPSGTLVYWLVSVRHLAGG